MKIFNTPILLFTVLGLSVGCSSDEEETAVNNTANNQQVIATPNLSLTTSTLGMSEPVNGNSSFNLHFKVSSTSDSEISFNLSAESITATEDDFVAINETYTLTAGTSEIEVPITIKGDNIDEDEEYIKISLSEGVGLNLPSQTEFNLSIFDEDPTPEIQTETEFAQVIEGIGEYELTFNLSNPSSKTIEMPYSISGLATEGQDYEILSENPLIINAGETSATLIFDLLDDDLPEGGEIIKIAIEQPINASINTTNEVALYIPGDIQMNDTGITTWYDGNNFNEINKQKNYPLQDAEFGRDHEKNDDYDGASGFSFTKISASGNALPSDARNFRCVKDNNTGLIWEVKKGPQELLPYSGEELKAHLLQVVRNSKVEEDHEDYAPYPYREQHIGWQAENYKYYWYNTNATTNGGSSGSTGPSMNDKNYPIDNHCAYPSELDENFSNGKHMYCNTDVYTQAFNDYAVCGFKSWTLPTIEQLRSIKNYNIDSPNKTNYFPNMSESGAYLSNSVSADGKGLVWCFDYGEGIAKYCNKQTLNLVRMVRKGEL